jgi:hypothetical protein
LKIAINSIVKLQVLQKSPKKCYKEYNKSKGVDIVGESKKPGIPTVKSGHPVSLFENPLVDPYRINTTFWVWVNEPAVKLIKYIPSFKKDEFSNSLCVPAVLRLPCSKTRTC